LKLVKRIIALLNGRFVVIWFEKVDSPMLVLFKLKRLEIRNN
jgi:hypothetical protein